MPKEKLYKHGYYLAKHHGEIVIVQSEYNQFYICGNEEMFSIYSFDWIADEPFDILKLYKEFIL